MLDIVLFQPEIPPNTGNIIRLCANTGSRLHLIRPLGFELDDKKLRRAGLDYHEWATVALYDSLEQLRERLQPRRLLAFSTAGTTRYDAFAYAPGDALLFGPETRGLPTELLSGTEVEAVLRLPMVAGGRSLNLSNSVAVAIYEAWRQHGFVGARQSP